jgi:hypothetical protein
MISLTPSRSVVDSMPHPLRRGKSGAESTIYRLQACLDTPGPHHYVARDLKGCPVNTGKGRLGERADG